jgi:surface antigen
MGRVWQRRPPAGEALGPRTKDSVKAIGCASKAILMTRKTASFAALAVVLGLAACAPADQRNPGQLGENNKTTGGTLIGALGGALLGSQIGGGNGRIVGAVAGTMIGGFIGHEVGASLDREDVARAQAAQQRAYTAPIGQQIVWNNPDNGHSGTITPQREGKDTTGNYCREYQTTITVGGETQKAFGTACRQPDGSWKVVNN